MGFELRKVAETATTITLEWDRQPGDGYRFYVDGVAVSRTFDPARTSVKFGKADSYRVEVLKVSAADSGVFPAPVTPPPPPPPPPPTGVTIQTGQSWQAAYNAAPAGSVLNVAVGNHGEQVLSGSKAMTFLGQDGARLESLANDASSVTLDNVNIDGGGDRYTILKNEGSRNTYRNLEVCNNTDQPMVGNYGSFAVFENVYFHHAVMTPAGESAGVHMEGVWSNGPNPTFRECRFSDCAVMGLFITRGDWWGQPHYGGVTIENCIFEPSRRTNNQGSHFFTVGVHDNADSLDRYVVRGNRFDAPFNTGANPAVNSVFCGNTGSVPESWKTPCA
jgi:hypothetical protein